MLEKVVSLAGQCSDETTARIIGAALGRDADSVRQALRRDGALRATGLLCIEPRLAPLGERRRRFIGLANMLMSEAGGPERMLEKQRAVPTLWIANNVSHRAVPSLHSPCSSFPQPRPARPVPPGRR